MTARNHGGEREELAPVIPLFGADATRRGTADQPSETDDARPWHATWIAERAEADAARAAHPASAVGRAAGRGAGDPDDGSRLRALGDEGDTTRAAEEAERLLLRKLRTRSLSLREARAVLREHELGDGDGEAIVERFVSLGYLDDGALAEQLIDKATSRKAQGRQAIAQTLAQRGIPREVIDEALARLPDDEAERALDFARSKASGFDGVERDAALRRLAGQLARRGYGSVALSAARQALDERSAPPRHGVRFEP